MAEVTRKPGPPRLKNPLDEYRSYSTHFVMAVAHTTKDLEAFTDPSNARQSLEAINKTKNLGDTIPFGANKAFLVMDTRRFSQFSIQNMKFDVYIANVTDKRAHSNFGNEIEMTILDGTGISFVNFLQYVLDVKVQANFDGMYFLMRVIFVGHKDDGSTEFVQSLSIPMSLQDMSLDLNHTQGVYQCRFLPLVNFEQEQAKRWLQLSTATSFFSGINAPTLGAVIAEFNDVLNKKSKEYYDKLNSLLKNVNKDAQQVPNKRSGQDGYGKLVQYAITIPDKWKPYRITGGSPAAAIEKVFARATQQAQEQAQKTQAQDTNNPVTSVHLSVTPSVLITDALDEVFKHVDEIAKLGNDERTEKTNRVVRFYKHVIGITSDDTTTTVHCHVIEYEVPEIKVLSAEEQARQQFNEWYVKNPERPNTYIPKNSFRFDYIYTGKNSDVLGMDLKIQELQFLLYANTGIDMEKLFAVSEHGAPRSHTEKNQSRSVLYVRRNDPLLMPLTTREEEENYRNFASLQGNSKLNENFQQYKKNLSLFYSASPIETSMTIRGNPRIMAEFAIQDFLPHAQVGETIATVASENPYRKQFEERILKANPELRRKDNGDYQGIFDKTYMSHPVFCKLNVFGPRTDITGVNPPREKMFQQEYAEELFYDGYFIVHHVTNIIENGVFTQKLDLRSLVLFGHDKNSEPGQTGHPVVPTAPDRPTRGGQ